jgi:hypothetical protein
MCYIKKANVINNSLWRAHLSYLPLLLRDVIINKMAHFWGGKPRTLTSVLSGVHIQELQYVCFITVQYERA